MAQEGAEIPNGFVQVNFLAGFVIADTKTYDASPRALAKMANAIMVPVDYHLAPEHTFPAAPDDPYGACKWTLAHVKECNGDPSRVAVGADEFLTHAAVFR